MATNSPVTPADIKAVIASPTSSMCGNMVSTLLKLPVLIYNFIGWILNSDGSVSDFFIAQIQKPGDLIFSAAPLAVTTSRILADGAIVSRATYANLFAAIGTTYGVGDGSTTFQLPDFRNNFPVGAALTLPAGRTATQSQTPYPFAVAGGEAKHLLTVPELPAFPTWNPYINDPAQTAFAPSVQGGGTEIQQVRLWPVLKVIGGDGTVTDPTPSNTDPLPTLSPATGHNNTPEYLACWVYVKT